MTIQTKILIAIAAILTFGALGFIIYTQHELKVQQTQIQTQVVAQQQLVDGIVRSQSQYATKDDIANFANQNGINLKAIQDNLDKLNASVASINVISTDSDAQNGNNLPSSGQGPKNPNPTPPTTVPCTGGTATCPNTDPYGYQKAQQNLALSEDFGTLKVPFGTVGFSAWQQNPWSVQIAQRDYTVDTVVGTDENQRQYYYNKFSVTTNGHTYEIPIKSATTKQQVPTAKFSWWNPRLLLGLDGGVALNPVKGEFTPNISVGIMSYGQYKTTPDWSILEVGAGYGTVSQRPQLVVTPVAYNIGKNLFSPLMNNTYIGPSLSVGTNGNVGVNLGLRVGF